MSVLPDLAAALASGTVEVIDLTAPLSSSTPTLKLPPQFGQTATFEFEQISNYDDRGPAWYWNNFRTGEHTGTHFDAPCHWVTGKGGEDVASVPAAAARRAGGGAGLLGAGNREPGLPARGGLTSAPGSASTARCRKAAGCCTAPDGTPGHTCRTHSSTPTRTARTPRASRLTARGGWPTSRRSSDWAWKPWAPMPAPQPGSTRSSPVTTFMHGAGKYGLTQLQNLALLPPTGAILIASPLEDPRRLGQPGPRAGAGRTLMTAARGGRDQRWPGWGSPRLRCGRLGQLPRDERPGRRRALVSSPHGTKAGAATMADAYSRMSGTVAAVTVHQGCGLTNAMTGIAEAAKSRTPLIVLAAEVDRDAVELLCRPGRLGRCGRRGHRCGSTAAEDAVRRLPAARITWRATTGAPWC